MRQCVKWTPCLLYVKCPLNGGPYQHYYSVESLKSYIPLSFLLPPMKLLLDLCYIYSSELTWWSCPLNAKHEKVQSTPVLLEPSFALGYDASINYFSNNTNLKKNFCRTAKWFSYMCVCVHILFHILFH